MIVLGSFPEYLEEASRQGANALAVPAKLWQFLENYGDQWTTNRSFLDATIRFHDEILLATNPASISSGSLTMQELTYLRRHGFHLDPTGTRLSTGNASGGVGKTTSSAERSTIRTILGKFFPGASPASRIKGALTPSGSDREFEEAVRRPLDFLFQRFGASIRSNHNFPRAFGNTILLIETKGLRLRVVRDRGTVRLDVAPLHEPNEWVDSAFALAALESESVESEISLDSAITSIARHLDPKFQPLQDAFAPNRYSATEQRIEQIRGLARVKAIERINAIK